MRFSWRKFLAATCLAAFATAVGAQAYPSKPVTLIAPSSPGSAPDMIARYLAERLSAQLGQQVIVANRPGAGGNIASNSVAKAAPDGYTILLGTSANVINPHLLKSLPFNLADLAPVSSVAGAPDILVVHPSVPAKTVAELVAMLKSQPATSAAFTGSGTSSHLSLEVFRKMAGVEVNPIPYQGGGQAQQGILGGQVAFMFSTTVGILPRIRSGQLRALAVTSAKRIAAAPELPTVAESGLTGFDTAAWFGIFAPANTPKPIIDQLSREVVKALASPTLHQRLIDLGAEPMGSSPEDFAAFVHAEDEKWGKLIRKTGILIQ
jgi:tripartite-type tricarboxylate transporter receptor subunit TctC